MAIITTPLPLHASPPVDDGGPDAYVYGDPPGWWTERDRVGDGSPEYRPTGGDDVADDTAP